MRELTCTKAQCRNATDFFDLCETCIAEFEAWCEDANAVGEFDWDAWCEANQPVEDMIPDFDPTHFDAWTGGNDDA